MTMPSSFNVSGLLGGTAGQIDTTTLISQLMQAQAIPQTQLQTQLTTLQSASSRPTSRSTPTSPRCRPPARR